MKEITLYNGKTAIVDDDDYERLSQYKYYENNKGYAYRNLWKDKKVHAVYLHREVIGAPKGLQVDHINGNRLDNRKENLRLVTPQQNQFNLRKSKSEMTSKYKGVCWIKERKGWLAKIRINGKGKLLGLYTTEEAAANAYNHYAREYHKEYALFNDVPFDNEWKNKEIHDRKNGSGKSKYIGVSYRPKYDDWIVTISKNHKSMYLGTFKDEIEAAKAYNAKAIELHGDKAKLNKFD
jgi:hypothetical protein